MPDDEPHGGHFPGDPCVHGYLLIPSEPGDVDALKRTNEWLSTHLHDAIIQRAGWLPSIRF